MHFWPHIGKAKMCFGSLHLWNVWKQLTLWMILDHNNFVNVDATICIICTIESISLTINSKHKITQNQYWFSEHYFVFHLCITLLNSQYKLKMNKINFLWWLNQIPMVGIFNVLPIQLASFVHWFHIVAMAAQPGSLR